MPGASTNSTESVSDWLRHLGGAHYNAAKESTAMATTATHTRPAAKKRAPAAKREPVQGRKTTPWGREVLKRIDTLREALDGHKLA